MGPGDVWSTLLHRPARSTHNGQEKMRRGAVWADEVPGASTSADDSAVVGRTDGDFPSQPHGSGPETSLHQLWCILQLGKRPRPTTKKANKAMGPLSLIEIRIILIFSTKAIPQRIQCMEDSPTLIFGTSLTFWQAP